MALWNLPESDMVCSQACAKQEDFAKSTGEEVENALSGSEAFDLRVSFRQALSFSTPPLAFYRNHRPGGHSNLIFGVPLVDHGATEDNLEDNVPKVMRMCIDEVEKRGLNVDKIYWVSFSHVFGFMLSVPVARCHT
jgi:hypothetical protein